MSLETYEILSIIGNLIEALEAAIEPNDDTPGVITKQELWEVIQTTAIDAISELAD